MRDVWWDLLCAILFAAAFIVNLKTGKTHLFPYATFDREEEYQQFWMAQLLIAAGAILGACLGIAALFELIDA